METAVLLLGMLFGSVGFGYFWYGRKQRAPLPLLCGLMLMVIPWFVSSATGLFLLGTAACILPWILRV